VQVRRTGARRLTRSFHNKADADAWARQQEVLIDKHGSYVDRGRRKPLSLGDLLVRYDAEVTPQKKVACGASADDEDPKAVEQIVKRFHDWDKGCVAFP
jgi:hypothetical protein